MTNARLHLAVTGTTRAELGRHRGRLLGDRLTRMYDAYAALFRVVGTTEAQERAGAERTLETLAGWRPGVADELEAMAHAAGVETWQVVALNARTEILALGALAAHECTTVATRVAGRRLGVQTWDWHIELDPFWHTQEVDGPGHRYVGLTEQGILGKIGVNEAGLALHFNILGHQEDGAGGVPVHVLSAVVLAECATTQEAVELIRATPLSASSAFTMSDADRSVSVELSPVGVFEIEESDGAVVRTNHFQHPVTGERQKTELYEPGSTERFALVRQRLAGALPADREALVDLLVTGPGEAPVCSLPDLALPFGERWATLATVVTDPVARTLEVLDGMPSDARSRAWRVLEA
jgi:isopenicillin-N N-acyltransferase-like protein